MSRHRRLGREARASLCIDEGSRAGAITTLLRSTWSAFSNRGRQRRGPGVTWPRPRFLTCGPAKPFLQETGDPPRREGARSLRLKARVTSRGRRRPAQHAYLPVTGVRVDREGDGPAPAKRNVLAPGKRWSPRNAAVITPAAPTTAPPNAQSALYAQTTKGRGLELNRKRQQRAGVGSDRARAEPARSSCR